MSLAAKADGLIYYGPDLYHTNLPPFGDGTKYGTAPSYPVLFIRNCVSFSRRAFVCLSDFHPVSYGAIYCPCAAELSLHGAMNHYQYRCLTIESHARTGRCRSGSQRSHRRAQGCVACMLPCSGFIPEEQLQLYHCRCRLQIKNGAVLDLQCDTVLYVLYVCARACTCMCVCVRTGCGAEFDRHAQLLGVSTCTPVLQPAQRTFLAQQPLILTSPALRRLVTLPYDI